jgi:hypothetical protein
MVIGSIHKFQRNLSGIKGCVHNALFSLQLINGPNKLEC